MAQNRQDMGSGPVKPLLLQLMIPAVVAQVVNLLYNIVDRIYIGHIEGIGAAALTGVGLFAPILMLLNAFAMLIGAGGAPRTAIALGQGKKETAEKIVNASFCMLLIFSVVLTVFFYAASPTLLRWFGASNITLPYALDYSRIYILGSVFVLVVLGMNPFITTQGFAKISMIPMKWLNPIVFMFCAVGTFAINNNIYDVFLMIGAGIVGYVLIKLDFCMPPIILGLILSGTVEENLRRTLVISDGNLSIFLEHPIAMVLLVIAVISLLSPIIMKAVKKRSAQKQAQ